MYIFLHFYLKTLNQFFLVQIEGSSIREVIEENIGKDFDFVAFADKVRQHNIYPFKDPAHLAEYTSKVCLVYFVCIKI